MGASGNICDVSPRVGHRNAHRSNSTRCIFNETFGCSSRAEMWVAGDCHGRFKCSGNMISCRRGSSWLPPRRPCACQRVFEKKRSALPPQLPSASAAARPESPPAFSSGVALLVAIVADSGARTRMRTARNMAFVDSTHALHGARVDWAVCAYDDRKDDWQPVWRSAAALNHSRLITVMNHNDSSPEDPPGMRPLKAGQRKARMVLHRRLVRSAWAIAGRDDAWDAVWLPDDDLRLVRSERVSNAVDVRTPRWPPGRFAAPDQSARCAVRESLWQVVARQQRHIPALPPRWDGGKLWRSRRLLSTRCAGDPERLRREPGGAR
jgi:hypothetical protein